VLSPSPAYAGVILSVHATAAACVTAGVDGPAGVALAVLIFALGAAAAWNRALLRGNGAPLSLEFGPETTAVVHLAGGKRLAVRPLRGIGVTRFWVALAPVSLAGRGLLVTSAMAGKAGARLLRLWALWGRLPAPDGERAA